MVRPVVDGIRARHRVSVAEVDHQDEYRRATDRRRTRLGHGPHVRGARGRGGAVRLVTPRPRGGRDRADVARGVLTRGTGVNLAACRGNPATNGTWPADRPHATTHGPIASRRPSARSSPPSSREIDDERLELVTVTGVKVDNDLNRADVFYSALMAERDGRLDVVEEGLEAVRWRIQRVVNREIRARKTPQIVFHPDEVLRAALHIEDIIEGRVAARDRRGMSPAGGRGSRDPGPNGIAVVDKEAGWTTHDVVAKARGILGHPQGRPLGHARSRGDRACWCSASAGPRGCCGSSRCCPRPTRPRSASASRPRPSTPTGEVTATHDMAGLDPAAVVAAAGAASSATSIQVPPMVSAIKVDGRRLHELARAGRGGRA